MAIGIRSYMHPVASCVCGSHFKSCVRNSGRCPKLKKKKRLAELYYICASRLDFILAVYKIIFDTIPLCQIHQIGFTHKGEDTEWDIVLLRFIIGNSSGFMELWILDEVG